jgi:hypothetical protein
MAFDGSGNFNRLYSWVSDKNNGINITASRVDQEDSGFAAGLTLCVTRDGQGKMAANFLPQADATYDVGSVGARWGNGFFSGNLTIGGSLTVGGTAVSNSGSWTSTLSGGFTSNPTGTVKWRRYGTIAHVWCDTFITGTSNAGTDISMSGLPAEITPSSNRYCECSCLQDNSTGVFSGVAVIQSAGTILLQIHTVNTRVLTNSNAWTGSGTKGLGVAGWAITYGL